MILLTITTWVQANDHMPTLNLQDTEIRLLVETVILTSAYGLYWIISAAVPWSIPVTWWSLVLVVLLADITYYWEHRIAHEVPNSR